MNKAIFQRKERQAGRGGKSISITYVFFCGLATDDKAEQVKVLTRVRKDNPTLSFELKDIQSYDSLKAYNDAAESRAEQKRKEDALVAVRKLTPAQLAAARAMSDEDAKQVIQAAEAKAEAKAKADAEAKAEADKAAAEEAAKVASGS